MPNTTLASFAGIEGEALLLKLNAAGICVSTGSACATGEKEPSHVLKAMGVPAALGLGTVRFSLSRFTTAEEMAVVAGKVPELVRGLRGV